MVRWDISYDGGRAPSLPFGASATGMILYTQDGSMSACIAQADRANLSSDSVRSAPVAERLAAFDSFSNTPVATVSKARTAGCR